jgi:MFS family permease
MGGMVPLLVPLLILQKLGSPVHVGLVIAAYNLGGLAAPVWGHLADRFLIHRSLLAISLLLTAAGLAIFACAKCLPMFLGLALLQGVGTVGAMTLGNLFIVEAHPPAEWEARIGWYQTFNCSGQAGGMLLAAILSPMALEDSLLVASGLIGLAVLIGIAAPAVRPSATRAASRGYPPIGHFYWGRWWPKRWLHSLRSCMPFQPLSPASKSFRGLIGVWFLGLTGASILFTLYPLMLPELYGIMPGRLALTFAAAMGLGVFIYPQAGRLSQHFGAARLYTFFLSLRLIAFIAVAAAVCGDTGGRDWFILLAYAAVVLCWPFLSVSGTALAAALAPPREGERMGLFNATGALALAAGPTLGCWLADVWGYPSACLAAVSTEILGVCLVSRIRRHLGWCGAAKPCRAC